MAPVRHRFVIRHPDTGAVLLERDGDDWRLPHADLEERHTAEVEHVNAGVRQRWGLSTTALRGLGHRAHELECHEPPPVTPSGAWLDLPTAAEIGLGAEDDRVLAACSEPPPADCGWMQPGWWTGVGAWVEAQLGPAEIVQTRSWESSCVASCRRQ